MEFFLVKFVLIGIVMAFANMCNTLYFRNVAKKKAHTAAFWSAMLILVNAITIVHYVEDQVYILAALLGTYGGTFFTLKWEQKKMEN
ncbi:hypothetical protein ABF87_07935 [Nitrosomonas sp. JL21]|uniref:hypothetical protein n=1 Tax=Nitrosomonas sp. JL21 TaxID=153949 RepID=UPI0013722007|nr:hypothetical protein [Nitrosomonas sp. JL21]MBL8496304.1 hypothetical protein [Nitrosomonas sp.]MCC7091198.1 hypothetical protein [Nitrosomonas sp.]MXS77893.1 hypothetical protein [Nitrosomonas sp. JL21]